MFIRIVTRKWKPLKFLTFLFNKFDYIVAVLAFFYLYL